MLVVYTHQICSTRSNIDFWYDRWSCMSINVMNLRDTLLLKVRIRLEIAHICILLHLLKHAQRNLWCKWFSGSKLCEARPAHGNSWSDDTWFRTDYFHSHFLTFTFLVTGKFYWFHIYLVKIFFNKILSFPPQLYISWDCYFDVKVF